MDAKIRARLGEMAVKAAQAAGYVGAGTCEFLRDADGSFYFMEMNARLQVEHPVTEMVTGLDLVKLQIQIAAGEPIPFEQKDVALRGWAFECRIFAEDPSRNFMPSPGRIGTLRIPAGPGIRDDGGVYQGYRSPSTTTRWSRSWSPGRRRVRRRSPACAAPSTSIGSKACARRSRSTAASSATPPSSPATSTPPSSRLTGAR